MKINMVWTYFIQSERGGPIKIGISKNPQKRLSSLQTSSTTKLRLLLQLIGDRERELHERFSEYRIKGEWFEECEEIIKFINRRSFKKFKKRNKPFEGLPRP